MDFLSKQEVNVILELNIIVMLERSDSISTIRFYRPLRGLQNDGIKTIFILLSSWSGNDHDRIYNNKMRYSYVYMMTNPNNTTIYIGVTNNLIRRVYEHKEKAVPGFTEKYNLTKLVYYEVFEDINEAIKREKQLKNWHREWKINLIKKVNPAFNDLYKEII